MPLYFHRLCLSSSVISQKIRLPVRLMPRLFRCKISLCSVAGSQRKKNSSLLNQLTDNINYYSMWVSAVSMMTARFPSLWMGYCDVCDLPGGRSVIWHLEACRRVYKLPNCITLTNCMRVKCFSLDCFVESFLMLNSKGQKLLWVYQNISFQEWVK